MIIINVSIKSGVRRRKNWSILLGELLLLTTESPLRCVGVRAASLIGRARLEFVVIQYFGGGRVELPVFCDLILAKPRRSASRRVEALCFLSFSIQMS